MNESDVTGVTGAPRIAVHLCLKRQKPDSRFSHFDGSNKELIQLTAANFSSQKPGEFEGSLIITVPSNGKFFARVTKEIFRLDDPKPAAEKVRLVLHSRQRLETVDGEKNLPEGIDWFIVSINACAQTFI